MCDLRVLDGMNQNVRTIEDVSLIDDQASPSPITSS